MDGAVPVTVMELTMGVAGLGAAVVDGFEVPVPHRASSSALALANIRAAASREIFTVRRRSTIRPFAARDQNRGTDVGSATPIPTSDDSWEPPKGDMVPVSPTISVPALSLFQ